MVGPIFCELKNNELNDLIMVIFLYNLYICVHPTKTQINLHLYTVWSVLAGYSVDSQEFNSIRAQLFKALLA